MRNNRKYERRRAIGITMALLILLVILINAGWMV